MTMRVWDAAPYRVLSLVHDFRLGNRVRNQSRRDRVPASCAVVETIAA